MWVAVLAGRVRILWWVCLGGSFSRVGEDMLVAILAERRERER